MFAVRGARLLRPARAGGYLAEWTRWLAQSEEPGGHEAAETIAGGERDRVGVLIFRLGQEWLAFRTQTVAEVTLPRPVHRIPHRSNDVLIGLVNLRGQLQLCISLSGLLGVESALGPPRSPSHDPSDAKAAGAEAGSHQGTGAELAAAPGTRLVVLRDRERSETWVFPAEEVLGVHRLPRGQMRSVSSALANPDVSFSQAILSWRDRSVSFLDEQRVFAALEEHRAMSDDLSGFSMMDLFRMEAEERLSVLSQGLVALEGSGATAGTIEPLMRGALAEGGGAGGGPGRGGAGVARDGGLPGRGRRARCRWARAGSTRCSAAWTC